MRNINVRMSLPEDLHRKIKITAATNGMNIADAITFVLQKYYEVVDKDEKTNSD